MAARLSGQAGWIRRDALFIALALLHGALLLAWPSIILIGIGLWWNANTISHNFIHRPFFRMRGLNAAFSCYLSLLLGFPQSLWRARHLAHHGARNRRESSLAPLDFVSALALWGALFAFSPHFALTVYLPGYLCGLGLCGLQGYYEHARGAVSHYGWLYNFLFFNDGYHVEHHAHPGMHWRELHREKGIESNTSRYPAALRWLESANLCALERLVLRSSSLQRFVIDRHERALRDLLSGLPFVHEEARVGIVGGGLFPRTAIILKRIRPRCRLSLIDMSGENLAVARRFVGDGAEYINDQFDPATNCDYDLLIIPLSLVGERQVIYLRPPAPAVLVHDWIWRPRGTTAVVSWLLLKRLNLIIR